MGVGLPDDVAGECCDLRKALRALTDASLTNAIKSAPLETTQTVRINWRHMFGSYRQFCDHQEH